MTHNIEAIFDDGVFRPLAPVSIPNGSQVRLHIEERAIEDDAARRRAAMDEFLRLAAELPLEGPDDGFSGADHDRVLYGKP
ncbi:MAG TPA: antitoxin family protein [Lacipirellulaceae bacterium]|nr:antitoxin family protein [Lacipirellulaceae bacterium]